MIRSLEGEAGNWECGGGRSLVGVEKLWGCHHIAFFRAVIVPIFLSEEWNEGLEGICLCSDFIGMCEAPGLSRAVPSG